jgi:hypothetical protein
MYLQWNLLGVLHSGPSLWEPQVTGSGLGKGKWPGQRRGAEGQATQIQVLAPIQ